MKARALIALVVVLTIVLATPSAAVAQSTYCPLTLWGQWNGVYYYYCSVCNPANGYNMVTASVPHELGVDCTKINDPIKPFQFILYSKIKVNFAAVAGEVEITPEKKATIKKMVRNQNGTKPGSGVDADSTFYPTANRSAPTTEWILKVNAKDGDRYFRALEFGPVTDDFLDLSKDARDGFRSKVFRIGQEINKTDVGTSTTNDAVIADSIDDSDASLKFRHHQLTFDSGKKGCYVTSFQQMEKP